MEFDYGRANEDQKKAINITEGPLLIIAGPGTGKTYTLVKRIAYLIMEKNVRPEEIFVATFTEKAAKELVTRITNELMAKNISVNLNEMYVGTFHSICLRILSEHLEYTSFEKNFRMLDQFDQNYMILQNLRSFEEIEGIDALYEMVKMKRKAPAWDKAKMLAALINKFVEEMVNTEKMKQDPRKELSAMALCMEKYRELLISENAIDFSTMQTECYALLKKRPEILKELQEKVKYLMVDEYQDTNFIQEQITFLLAGEKENICVVGDDDQGLYRFRGATIRNILEFPYYFEPGVCQQVHLTENYRSEEKIIDFYNEWMNRTSGEDFNFEWGDCRYPKSIVGKKEKIDRTTPVLRCSSDVGDPEWNNEVYEFIRHLKDSGTLSDYNQIAFLCRSVKSSKVVNLINYLESRGINVYAPRSDMFFKRPEIRCMLGCLLKCFPEYDDGFKNRDKDFNAYKADCMAAAAREMLAHPELAEWIEKKKAAHTNMTENADYAFTGMVYQLFAFEPFASYVNVEIGSGVVNERSARNLSNLMSALAKYEYLRKIDVFQTDRIAHEVNYFFEYFLYVLFKGGIEEYEDDSEYAPSGCVSFMTIHQSKGMEFPVVMVGSVNQQPDKQMSELECTISYEYYHRQPFEDAKKIPLYDLWRLFYTAFSRAQNLLVLTGKETTFQKYPLPSKYLKSMYETTIPWRDVDLSHVRLDSVKPVNLKETYSFTSHIGYYENCPLQYKYFKELGFEQVRTGATVFGTLVHETIEDVHKCAMRNEEDQITQENVRTWLDTNYAALSKKYHSYLGAAQIDAAYHQVMRYIQDVKNTPDMPWSQIQGTEVEVNLVKENYILQGKIDLIRDTVDGDAVELIDFKSEKRPDFEKNKESLARYKRQLEVYAHIVEQQTGKKVSKMHLYYTGEENSSPLVTFEKKDDSIAETIADFDKVVEKIQNREFSEKAKDKKSCHNCDMRYHCGEVSHK